MGLEVPRYEVDLPTIMARVHDLALARSEDISKVLADGARVVLGRAGSRAAHTVEGARRTGAGWSGWRATPSSSPPGPPPGADTAPADGEVILSSQDVYKLRKVPEHLVIVGAGATGVEYATTFLRFGAQVTPSWSAVTASCPPRTTTPPWSSRTCSSGGCGR